MRDAALAPAPNLNFEFSDLIGVPFKWGGRDRSGLDCYGLVETLLKRGGVTPPDYLSPTVHEQIASLIDVTKGQLWQRCEPGPGAVATVRIGSHVCHVGVVLPFGKFIHAWEVSNGVCVEHIDGWVRRITGFYRVSA